MGFQCSLFCNYILVYDSLRNSPHCIHILLDMGLCICSCYKPKSRGSRNRLSILVYNLGTDHRNIQASTYMIRHFLVLYILHSRHKAKVHTDLSTQLLEELKSVLNIIRTLTYNNFSYRRSTFLVRSVSRSLLGSATFSDFHIPATVSLSLAHRPKAAIMVDGPSLL